MRIKLSRKKGYRKPADAVVVARPTKWGNPFNWQGYDCDPAEAKRQATKKYAAWLDGEIDEYPEKRQWILDHIGELSGKTLACWCDLSDLCHADILAAWAMRRK